MTLPKKEQKSLFKEKNETIFSYRGPIFKEVIGFIGSYIKNQSELSKELKRKIYMLYVEAIQNISFYSIEKAENKNKSKIGIGTIFIYKNKHLVEILTGNHIFTKEAETIENRIKLLNSLNRKELRQFRRQEINRPFGDNDGAHIGMVNIILVSGHAINYDIKKIDNQTSFLRLKITVSSY